jgi:hypothetical protein
MRIRKLPQQGKAPTRRDFSIAALAGVSALVSTAAVAGAAKVPVSEKEALKALDPWIDAIVSGDPAVVEKVLAPEFQVLRSDGTGREKASYLKAIPRQRVRPKISDVVATGSGDVMVVRYRLETDQTVQGKDVKGISPRLSVFRRTTGRWLISAHANFSALA